LKRITQNHWKERLVIKCLENRIALYSPHTASDAMYDGESFLPPFLPPFLPYFLPSFFPSLLPYFLPSFIHLNK
jgi:hypothetical protein